MIPLRDLPPLNVPLITGLGRVFAPVMDKWLPVWIEDGVLCCVACVVPKHLMVEWNPSVVDAMTNDQQRQFASLMRQYPKAIRAALE